MKISLVGSLYLADGYLGAANALRRRGAEVAFVPAQLYGSEHPKEHVSLLTRDIKQQDADFVLWWRSETLSHYELGMIKRNTNKRFVLYSWDDPHQWEQRHDMPFKCEYLDMCFSCCMDSVKQYTNNGSKGIYCPAGFDPQVHKPEFDPNYECDISIVCTNLYDGNITRFPHINRREFLSSVIASFPDKDIRIYGPESFREAFPDNYHGWVNFNDSHLVFYNSKVNISTHIRPDGSMYINERVCQILGSKGLLLVDKVKDIHKVLVPDKHCLTMDINATGEAIEQMKTVLENNRNFDKIRDDGYHFAMEKLTWDNWAETVLINLERLKSRSTFRIS